MEIKVMEINSTLNSRPRNERQHKLTRLKLTRILEIRVNFMKR